MGSCTGLKTERLQDFHWEAPRPRSCLLRWAVLLALPEGPWHLQSSWSMAIVPVPLGRAGDQGWAGPLFLPVLSCHPRTHLKEPRLPGQGRAGRCRIADTCCPGLGTGDPGLGSRKVEGEMRRAEHAEFLGLTSPPSAQTNTN